MDDTDYRRAIPFTSPDNSRPKTTTERTELAAIVTRLLSHYWTDADHIETRRAQIADWIEDLVEFGPATVIEACREWRRTETKRPMPANIRQLCIELKRQQRERIALAAPSDMDGYARSLGWANEAERRNAIRHDERERELRYERARIAREEMALMPLKRTAGALVGKQQMATPEQLRAGRIALGIEPPEPAEVE